MGAAGPPKHWSHGDKTMTFPQTFALSDEQKMMTETVRRFIKTELQPLEDGIEARGHLDADTARTVFAKANALGLYALNMPAEHGGGGLSTVDRILCEEQFGHTSDILIRRAFGNVYEPLLACRGAQIERWLRPAVRGERTCSIAITEPGAGSDAQGIRTTARWTTYGVFLASAAVSALIAEVLRVNPMKSHIYRLDMVEQNVLFCLALLILVLAWVLSKYPLNLPRNIVISGQFFSLCFLTDAVSRFITLYAPPTVTPTVTLVGIGLEVGLWLYWAYRLETAQEHVPVRVRPPDPREQELLDQLDALNRVLSRASRG